MKKFLFILLCLTGCGKVQPTVQDRHKEIISHLEKIEKKLERPH